MGTGRKAPVDFKPKYKYNGLILFIKDKKMEIMTPAKKRMLNKSGATVDNLVEGLKRLDATQFSEFCQKACEDNLASRLIELLSIERMDKDNADHELASKISGSLDEFKV
jgi:hypothetical protein